MASRLVAGGAAVVALAALGVFSLLGGFVASCTSQGTGVRDEGPARGSASTEEETPSASPSSAPPRVDAVRLLMDDPDVDAGVKEMLRLCTSDKDSYPVDAIYGNLTDGGRDDVVVNVLTCGDAVSIGTYVYRPEGDDYTNAFRSDGFPVYAEIDRRELVVTQQVYSDEDPVAAPSGEDVITYRWKSGDFVEQGRVHNDYSKAVGTESASPPRN
ncbi:hypothetical protein ACWD6I_06525 [Streptomyces sp. NPDC002454]|uniref:hypothetical protein n=1 Tax=Streptomyces sp. NPDC002490 TaxID=3154416 RepID=UPI0033324B2E